VKPIRFSYRHVTGCQAVMKRNVESSSDWIALWYGTKFWVKLCSFNEGVVIMSYLMFHHRLAYCAVNCFKGGGKWNQQIEERQNWSTWKSTRLFTWGQNSLIKFIPLSHLLVISVDFFSFLRTLVNINGNRKREISRLLFFLYLHTYIYLT
jgi:hypothetical protein